MKRLSLFVFALLLSNLVFGQTIHIQAGTSLSKLDWQINQVNMDIFNEALIGSSVFAGMDYFEKKYFNLSSNLGYIRKGGKDLITLTDERGYPIDESTEKAKLNYVTANTTLELKYPIREKIIPFIGAGPRIDYLISHNNVFDSMDERDVLNDFNIGLILGGGIKYDLSEFQIGLRADYYLNFANVADWPAETGYLAGKVKDKTMTLNMTIGYKL